MCIRDRLYRINAQSQVYEQALTEAQIPYQVRGGDAFFARTEIRQALREIVKASRAAEVAAGDGLVDALRLLLFPPGLTPQEPPGGVATSRRGPPALPVCTRPRPPGRLVAVAVGQHAALTPTLARAPPPSRRPLARGPPRRSRLLRC